jgi:hypothetical protein
MSFWAAPETRRRKDRGGGMGGGIRSVATRREKEGGGLAVVGVGRATWRAGAGGERGVLLGWATTGPLLWADPMKIVFFDLFKLISNGMDLIRSKDGLLEFENFQIKYGCEGN